MKKFKIHKINFLIAPLFMALISCGKTDTNTNSAADEVTNNEEEPSEDPLGGEEDPKERLLNAVKANKPQLFNVTLEGNPGLKEDKPFLGKALLLAVEPHKDGKPSENGKLSQHKKNMAEILLRELGEDPESAKQMGKALVKLAKQKIHGNMGRDIVALIFSHNDMQNCGEAIGEALIEFCKKDDKNNFVCESVARLCENKIPYKKSSKAIEAALAREVKNGEAHITLEELKIVEAVLKGIGRHSTVDENDFVKLMTLLCDTKEKSFVCKLARELKMQLENIGPFKQNISTPRGGEETFTYLEEEKDVLPTKSGKSPIITGKFEPQAVDAISSIPDGFASPQPGRENIDIQDHMRRESSMQETTVSPEQRNYYHRHLTNPNTVLYHVCKFIGQEGNAGYNYSDYEIAMMAIEFVLRCLKDHSSLFNISENTTEKLAEMLARTL